MTRKAQNLQHESGSGRSRKVRWLSGSSMAAATFLLASTAHAQVATPVTGQAFQANITAQSNASLTGQSTTLDTLTVTGTEAFINWQPLDTNAPTIGTDGVVTNPINILPSGRTMRFVSNGLNYTVLNRILPAATADGRPVQFNGIVESFIDSAATTPGGAVWFYSPGGIIAGAASRFDVGSLVLTTNNIDTTGSFFGASGEIRFRGAADSKSSIAITAGAQINALNNGSSYVAMVAPRIVQGGTVNVNGSAAYVAAEQADLTINNGLFDIAIGVGTTDANGVVHSGTTTGPSSTPSFDGLGNTTNADAQAIHMVAVPKNDALTMLVGGSLGYQPAASASIINGNVVLSAGANVATTGNQTNASFAFDKTAADSDSNIRLQNVFFDSSVSTFATNGIAIANTSETDFTITGNSVGTQDMLLEARNQIDIDARGGASVRSNGNITLRAGTDGVGGTININVDQVGAISPSSSGFTASGNLVVDTSATGLDDFFTVLNNGGTGIGQDAVGGDININISGNGNFVVGGAAQFIAGAQGGKGENQNGSGQGGNINLDISSGTFNVTGTTFFETQAIEAQNLKIGGNGPGLIGSDSIGGNVTLALSGGAITTGNIFVNLGAIASVGDASSSVQSNDATAGAFDLTVTGGAHVINDINIDALANASIGSFDATGTGISGFARSGGANFLIDSGSLTVNADIDSNFSTYGIAPANPADRVVLTVQNSGTLAVTGSFNVNTVAYDGIDTTASTGGSISILTDNGTITTGGIFLDSSARPNNIFSFTSADEGRDFQAGDINLVAQNGGSFTSAFSYFTARATGNDTNSGDGTGGDIFIHANNGSISFTDLVYIDTSGVGGVGGTKDNPASLGIGQGGAINLRVEGAGGSLSFADLDISSDGSIANDGEGGAPSFEGDGGFGFGGEVTFDVLGGTFTAGDITVGSDGSGGGGGDLVTLPMAAPAPFAALLAPPADLSIVSAATPIGISAGDGGDGRGGDVIFNLNGGTATVTNLSITANGFGGDGADGDINSGTAGGAGGRGIGGNATFNAQSGSLTVTSTLTVSAQGNNQSLAPSGSRGAGGFGYGSDGGAGGSGAGGTAIFNLDGNATITADQVVVSTSAAGGYGGSTRSAYGALGALMQAGVAGNGGDARGGDATFNNNAGTLNFSQLSVTSTGTGGDGGDVSGFSGGPDNIAGSGGSGTGGNATININQDDLNNPVDVVDASGVGGDGGDGLDGGNGGAASGGIAAININGTTAVLNGPTMIANATGGAGGLGRIDPATFNAGNSGDGGNATGGTARLEVTGAGGNIDLGVITLQSDAVGGQGGVGSNNFSGNAGNGGSGGAAAGGTTEIIARTGGSINFTGASFDLTTSGTGGVGGNGGYSSTPNQGNGGDGGNGTGGTGRLLAQGGTITGLDVSITSTGQGGGAGLGGNYPGYYGVDGNGGSGTGGAGVIEVQEGSPGIITVGNVTVIASGYNAGDVIGTPTGVGGRFEITDTSTDPAGLITLASLNVQALSAGGSPISGFFATGNSGPIAILGDLTVNVAGNIEYDLDGDGQMTVGGNARLTSGQSIMFDHSNNIIPVNSIDVSGIFAATAQADFVSTAGSRINAAGTATVRTGQNATVADIAGVGLVDISAMWDARVTNAAVTGIVTTADLGAGTVVLGPQMLIQAGHDPIGTPSPTPTASFDPNYDVTIDGDVTSTGFITINAGGSALFLSGSSTISDNGLTVQTGDDIIIQTGASLVAGNNSATTPNTGNPFPDANNLFLQAGSLTPLSTTTVTPIASIVAAGDIDANNFAVVMSANAIDGLGSTITASSLSADINDAPSNAVIAAIGQSDDNGLLSGQCVEGNICLGTLNADNFVYIGQASNNDVVQAIVESGTVSANDILVTTRRDIVLGTTGIATTLDAVNQLALQSNEGNIDLAAVSATSNAISINAAGSLLGTAALTSTNDIGITVGAGINAASIDTGGQLTQVADVGGASETNYDVPGSIAVGSYTQGTAVRFQVTAGNGINFNQITLPDQDINLIAGNSGAGDVFLGTATGAAAILLTGDNVGFNSLTSGLGTTLTANNGGVSGGLVDAGTFIDIDATRGDISGTGSLNAGAQITIDGSGNVTFGDATSPSTLTVNAGGYITFGTVAVVNAVDFDGAAVTVGTLNSASGNILATGAVDVNNILGIDHNFVGASINLNNGTTSGDLLLNANAGNISGTGNIIIGGGLDFDATGGIGFGNLTAAAIALNAGGLIGGGDLTATAGLNVTGGNIAIANAKATSINFVSGLNILFNLISSPNAIALTTANGRIGANAGSGNIDSGGNIDLTAQMIDVGDVLSGGSMTADATAGNASFGTVNATNNITVTATGTPTLANAISGGNTSITGASVTLNNGTIGGNLTLNATAGNLNGNGAVTVGGGINLDATGNIGFGDLDAQGGTFTVDAGGNINFASATSSDDMTLNAGGGMNGGDIDAGGAMMIDSGGEVILDNIAGGGDIGIVANNASDVTVGSVTGTTNVVVLTQGAFVADQVNSAKTGTGQVDIAADNGITLRNISGNDIGLTATNGLVNVTNNVDVTNLLTASGAAVSIVTRQDMRVSAIATNGDIGLSSTGSLNIQGAQATGDIVMASGSDILINGLVNASNSLQITATGLIDIQASAVASNIRTVSSDMNIGSAGSLGQTALTSDIKIFSNGTTKMVLGGASDPTGVFYLGNDEFSRIHSGGDLTIYAAETGLGGFDLTIQDLSASAFSGGNFGRNGNFNISADQSIRVDGRLSVGGDLDTKLNLAAGNDLFVNAATGSIGIGNDGTLTGDLSLTARNIYAMTDQAFADIQGLSTAGIDARLAQNDGTVRDSGFIVADAISVNLLASQFYVQNTGSRPDFDARRGFVVGTGGLTINTGPSGITPIVINGTINGVTGIAVIPATTITGAGFNQQSTINGCVINNPASCVPTPTPTPTPDPVLPEIDSPVQDVIEEEVTPEKYVADPFATIPITIKENEELSNEPLIDEPVTGAGNDDLWVRESDCEGDDAENCQVGEEENELEPAE